MDCEQVRASLEAFVAGELNRREAVPIADHLGECPACMLEHEELVELTADLRRARDAIRPLHSLGIAEFPAVQPRRRLHPAWAAAAALLGLWAAFATAVVLVPSLAQRVTVLPVGHELSVARQAQSAPASGGSLGNLPPSALSSVVALFPTSSTLFGAGGLHRLLPLDSLHLQGASVRLTTLGPVLLVTEQQVQVVADIDVIRRASPESRVQHAQLVLTVSKVHDGHWVVTKAAVRPR